jgi:hypothetical protein
MYFSTAKATQLNTGPEHREACNAMALVCAISRAILYRELEPMSNSNWPDNIPPQGMLCTGYGLLHKIVAKADEESYPGGVCVVSDTGAHQFVSNLTPITPQDWWDFAPWIMIWKAFI